MQKWRNFTFASVNGDYGDSFFDFDYRDHRVETMLLSAREIYEIGDEFGSMSEYVFLYNGVKKYISTSSLRNEFAVRFFQYDFFDFIQK